MISESSWFSFNLREIQWIAQAKLTNYWCCCGYWESISMSWHPHTCVYLIFQFFSSVFEETLKNPKDIAQVANSFQKEERQGWSGTLLGMWKDGILWGNSYIYYKFSNLAPVIVSENTVSWLGRIIFLFQCKIVAWMNTRNKRKE